MRILFIAPFLPYPENSGSKIRAMGLLRSLKGNELLLFAFGDQKERVHFKELKKLCSELFVFQKPKISPFQKFLNHFSSKPLLSKRFWLKEVKIKIEEILKEKKIDLVVVETLHMAEYVKSLKGLCKVLDEHNLEFVRAGRRVSAHSHWIRKIYYYLIMMRLRRYELKTIKMFDKCLVCSESDRKTINGFIPNKKVTVIPNSVDVNYFGARQGAHDSKSIIFTGTMWYEPNVDAVKYFAREIFPLLREDLPDIEFVIVGDKPTEDVIVLSKEKGISVTGYTDDIRPYLSTASIFVAPIRMGSGTRLKILSAMCAGLPVVSTSVGCEGLDVVDDENICIAESPQQFRDKIIRLLEEKDYRERIATGGKRLVEKKYSREVIEEKLIRLWKGLESELIRAI